ncbi:MAG: hypothetical protein ACREGR_02170 [Minisyncoccia bacterium]
MTRLWPILALLAFTNPNGVRVWIDSESIVSVAPGVGQCVKPTMTYLDLGGYGYCVREDVSDVLAKIKADD